MYLIELSSAAEPYFAQLITQYGLPPGLARVFQHQITPGMLNENDLEVLFPPDRFTRTSYRQESYSHRAYPPDG